MRHSVLCLLLFTAAGVAETPLSPPPDLLKEIANRSALSLADFTSFALATNPTLAQAKALTRESGARATQAALLPNPTIGYQGEHIRGGSYGGGEQGAFVQQDIPLGGKLGLRKNISEQQRRADQFGAEEQRARVTSGVAQSFYSTLAAQEIIAVRHHLLDLALDAVQTAHQLANIGQADEPDILQAEIEAEQASAEFTAAQRHYIARFKALAASAGKPDLPLAPIAGRLEAPPSIAPDSVLDTILRDSPSLKRARQEIARAEAEWKSAKRESVPDLQLRGGLEQSNELLELGQSRIVGVQGFATAGITLPLFNRNQGNVAAAQAALERARAEVTRVELSLRQSASQMLEQYRTRLSEAALYRNEMLPRANRAYQLYLDKYGKMGAAYPHVLVSQRTLFQLEASYVNVLENLWTTSIALQNYTLSGPLDSPAPPGPSR